MHSSIALRTVCASGVCLCVYVWEKERERVKEWGERERAGERQCEKEEAWVSASQQISQSAKIRWQSETEQGSSTEEEGTGTCLE